jgi:hypothetical protein
MAIDPGPQFSGIDYDSYRLSNDEQIDKDYAAHVFRHAIDEHLLNPNGYDLEQSWHKYNDEVDSLGDIRSKSEQLGDALHRNLGNHPTPEVQGVLRNHKRGIISSHDALSLIEQHLEGDNGN